MSVCVIMMSPGRRQRGDRETPGVPQRTTGQAHRAEEGSPRREAPAGGEEVAPPQDGQQGGAGRHLGQRRSGRRDRPADPRGPQGAGRQAEAAVVGQPRPLMMRQTIITDAADGELTEKKEKIKAMNRLDRICIKGWIYFAREQ